MDGPLLDRGLRANPAYELVLFDRLPAEERGRLAELRRDPDFYGLLRPRDGGAGLGLKSVDRDTALLFLTLRDPGPLPSYVRAIVGADGAHRTVSRLVADGILEIEDRGEFVSGAAALALLEGRRAAEGGGRIAEISRAALRYAQDLAVDDPLVISNRLYGYNRRPLTPAWKRRLAGPSAVPELLGISVGGPNRRRLDSFWASVGPSDWWLSWSSRAGEALGGGSAPTYKLYVSPVPEALPESFGAVLEAFAAARAPQFKVGADAWGLLRADKIVAYFPTFERLAEASEAIAARLAGIPAQGVPFTSEIGGDGLLSWGVDPPRDDSPLGRESWRLWLTHRLARAILSARIAKETARETARETGAEGVEPWRFALERLRLEGVDTETWTPGATLWKSS